MTCTRLELDVFTFSQVVGHLADDRAYTTPRQHVDRPPANPTSVVDGLARTVAEATVGNRNAALYWAANRLRDRGATGEAGREALRQAALATGLSESETERTLDSALNAMRAAA